MKLTDSLFSANGGPTMIKQFRRVRKWFEEFTRCYKGSYSNTQISTLPLVIRNRTQNLDFELVTGLELFSIFVSINALFECQVFFNSVSFDFRGLPRTITASLQK